jgi:hypothetical protein|nr:hypothetical protein [Maricaulis virginensis]
MASIVQLQCEGGPAGRIDHDKINVFLCNAAQRSHAISLRQEGRAHFDQIRDPNFWTDVSIMPDQTDQLVKARFLSW